MDTSVSRKFLPQESDTNEIILPNSSDSVNIDEQTTPQIDVQQIENNNNQSNDITNVTENSLSLSISNNEAIDFGENDPSTINTTIKDETNDSLC
ncbi:unnamed protein product [Rotaria sp. Silwood2]|nr:unnamed protein product [Rotaria sp. Silwood2]CAF4462484.1 unnamed protein product [Rotaria sp. Silwood2]